MKDKHPSGGKSTAAARQRAWKLRATEAGLKKVSVMVPVSREDEIREIARQMRDDPQACGTNRGD
jgi:hypothetical protein